MPRLLPRLCASLSLLLAAQAAQAAEPDDIARGRTLAQSLCAQCHMGQGQGEKQGREGVPSFAAVARRPQQNIDGIVNWLRSVPPMMPNHRLTQDEMYDLAAFILSLKS